MKSIYSEQLLKVYTIGRVSKICIIWEDYHWGTKPIISVSVSLSYLIVSHNQPGFDIK